MGRRTTHMSNGQYDGKYLQAFPSRTRAYITVEQQDNRIKICFKNVSKEKLNITAEEPHGTFCKGDSSRTSEGSGLGLSIAKSLTEIMQGTMQLEMKVTFSKPALYSIKVDYFKQPERGG